MPDARFVVPFQRLHQLRAMGQLMQQPSVCDFCGAAVGPESTLLIEWHTRNGREPKPGDPLFPLSGLRVSRTHFQVLEGLYCLCDPCRQGISGAFERGMAGILAVATVGFGFGLTTLLINFQHQLGGVGSALVSLLLVAMWALGLWFAVIRPLRSAYRQPRFKSFPVTEGFRYYSDKRWNAEQKPTTAVTQYDRPMSPFASNSR